MTPRILARLFGRLAPETRAAGVYGAAAFGPIGTAGGGAVSPAAAESLSTVCACVGAISSGLASLPARIYRVEGDRRTEAPEHPVARLVRAPNPRQSWPDFAEWLMGQVLLQGNALAQIESDGAGRPVALVPIPWQYVQPVLLPSRRGLAFDVVAHESPFGGTGQRRRLLESEVLHLRDRSDDGFLGRSRLSRAGEVLQAAAGLQRYSTAVWENAATPSGVVTFPKSISGDGIKRMRAHIEAATTGAHNAKRVMFLETDSTWTPMSVSPEDAEVLASRRFTGEELARLFQVPPAIIGDLSHGTFTNSETAGRWFAQFTLAPWARKLESEVARSLLDPAHELELDLSALMRGDDAARWAAHKIAVEAGVLDPAEIRGLEGWNPRPAGTAPVPLAGAVATDSAPATATP